MAQLYLRTGLHDRPRPLRALLPLATPTTATTRPATASPPGSARSPLDDRRPGPAGRRRRPARPPRRAPASGCSTTRSARGSAGVDFGGLRIDAVPEGRVVHPNTPITVVEGPLAAAQLLETPLLNQLNFATLIATKAARVVEASHGRPVLEFGMRRAAADGADAASRAAIVGGAVVDVEQRRRLRARAHAGRYPRPLDGPAVPRPRRRASRPRSTPTPTPIPTTRCCSSTPSTRWAAASPTPSPRSSACAVPGTSRSASASTPATSPTSPCSRRASSTGPGSPTPSSCCRASSTS